MDQATLRASLDTLDGWKRINPKFLFVFGGGAKSHAVWERAQQKAVCQNHLLAQFEHDDDPYFVYAFSSTGAVDPAHLQSLQAAAQQLPLGTVRYESLSYTSLEPWRGAAPDDDETISALGDPGAGLFVFAVADSKGPFPVVAYANDGGKHCIFPVPAKFL